MMNLKNIQSAPITGQAVQFPLPPPPPPHPQSPTSPRSTASSGLVTVVSPCAACKILRRRCVEKCVLAPYFPPTDPCKFTKAHRVFGAANIIKLLQELPELKRVDAVNSLVYEANARLRDPVYGCAGAICRLQDQISELKAELARTQAELARTQAELARTQAEAANLQCENSNSIALIYMEMEKFNQATAVAGGGGGNCNSAVFQQQQQQQYAMMDTSCFLDESNLSSGWEPLWA
ncbi:hypothetical protein SAY86_013660 [Trapa natans]|uniref:LOB domain-containing protein n=1 Tax=Trapa natans TaxID=22666 RepID=A0AAN7KRX1_TRANT|nr:hypothetical protein SAY86_013660 [Trapa natans]